MAPKDAKTPKGTENTQTTEDTQTPVSPLPSLTSLALPPNSPALVPDITQIAEAPFKKRKRWPWISAAAAVLIFSTSTIAYGAYFSTHALPGTMVGAHNVGGMTKTQVTSLINHESKRTEVKLTGAATAAVPISELGFKVDLDKTLSSAFSKNKSITSRFTGLFTPTKTKVITEVDSKKLLGYALKLKKNSSGVEPKSPVVTFNKQTQTFKIIPGIPGQGVVAEPIYQAAHKAAEELKSTSATVTIGKVEPLVSDQAAKELARAADNLVKPEVTITSGEDTFTASVEDKASWVKIDATVPDVAPTYEESKIADWVQAQAKTITKSPANGIRNVFSDGKVARIIKEKVDGTQITNTTEVASAIMTDLGASKPAKTEFKIDKSPAQWTDRPVAPGAERLPYPAAAGEKWIDVNLSNFTTTAYEGSKPVMGPFAIVKGAPATPTITGTFAIDRKYTSKTMRGRNADGTPYETPNVPWAMYFSGGYALHGAPWRSSFGYGGPSGSHGCVNMPVSAARSFYSWAPTGTPVITHH